MADEPKPLLEILTAEQKPLLEAELKKARETAVTEFKATSEAERKKLIPEKYEFKFAEDSPLDSKTDAAKISTLMRDLGLTAEQAKRVVSHHEDVAGGILQRQKQQLSDQVLKWKSDFESDKELGGANKAATMANIGRFMNHFAPGDEHEFRKLLDATGYGNHPVWLRIANAIGKAMAEDKPIGGGGGGKPKPLEDHEVFYPTAS